LKFVRRIGNGLSSLRVLRNTVALAVVCLASEGLGYATAWHTAHEEFSGEDKRLNAEELEITRRIAETYLKLGEKHGKEAFAIKADR
jgi:hypothetical protein